MREVAEECGLQITLEERLGAADQYVYSAQEATHFLKRSVFFRARIVGVITSWVGAAEAFVHESHHWAATRER
jgi:hypothetical protein